jgi:hypothetical protein
MVVSLVARNPNEAIVESGRVCVWWKTGVESCGWFYVGAFGRSLAAVALKVFSLLLGGGGRFVK